MAGPTTSRDVTLTLNLETLGQADVAKLQSALEQLAAEGGAAAPQFEKLADEISKLGAQTQAVTTFKDLSTQVDALGARQEATAQSAADMLARLEAVRASTAGLQAAQQAATDALTAGQLAYVNATNAIRALKTEYDNTGKQTTAYRDQLQALVAAQNDARAALVTLRADQRSATADANDAVSAQGKLETQYGRVSAAATKAASALTAGQSALQEQVAAAAELGVNLIDLASAEGQLVATFNEGATALNASNAAAAQNAAAQEALNAAMTEAAAAAAGEAAAFEAQQEALQAEFALMREVTESQEAFAAAVVEAGAAAEAAAAERVAAAEAAAAAEAETTAAVEAADAAWQADADALVNATEAANAQTAATEAAIVAQRELADQAAFAKVAEDAAKLNQAAEYVNFWRDALDAADESAKRTAAALQTLGVTDLQKVQGQLADVQAAMVTLEQESARTGQDFSAAFTSGNGKIAALDAQIRELTGTMTAGEKAAGLFSSAMGQFTVANLVAQGIASLVQKVKDLAVAFVESITDLQRFNSAMTAIYKNTDTVRSQLEFLRQTALDSGQSIGGLQNSFVQFSASMKTAGVSIQTSNALFAALTKSAGTLGLSTQETEGALLALSQMAAKGTVAMEELRQQLGDRLPGAMALAAQGLGLTEAQLIKLVESGQLASKDLFPALTQALGSMAGPVDNLGASFNTLKSALSEAAQNAGESGWTEILASGLRGLAVVVGLVVLPLSALSETVLGIAKAAGILVGSLVTLTNPLNDLKQVVDDAAARQQKLTDAFDKAAGYATTAAQATQQQTASIAALAPVITSLTTGVTAANAAQRLLAVQTALSGEASLTAQQKHNQLILAMDTMTKSLAITATAADTETKAVRSNGEQLVAVAKLRGDEKALLDASALASSNYAASVQKAADAHEAELQSLLAKKAEILQDAQNRNVDKTAVDAQVTALDGLIAKAQAQTDQSTQAAAADSAAAIAAKVAADAYGSTGSQVALYAEKLANAKLGVDNITSAELVGLATKAQVKQATDDVTAAQARYNAELAAAVQHIKDVATVEQAKADVQIAGLTVTLRAAQTQQTYYETLAQTALAEGNKAAATEYTRLAVLAQIDAIEVQIQITKAQAAADIAGANAKIAAQEALKQELIAEGNLTPAKKLEIEATELEAKAKLIAAGASKSVVEALDNEKDALLRKLDAQTASNASTQNGIGTTNADTAAREKNADAIDSQTAALQRQKGLSSTGLTKSDGSSNGTFDSGLPLDQIYSVLAKRDQGTLTADDLAAVQAALAQAAQANQYLHSQLQIGGSVDTQALTQIGGFVTVLQGLVQSLTQQAGSNAAAGSTQSGPSATGTGTSSVPSASTSHTVTVNFGTQSTTINTASPSDATSLANMVTQLAAAASRAQ